MGNLAYKGNSPTETPSRGTKGQAEQLKGRELNLQPITFEQFGDHIESDQIKETMKINNSSILTPSKFTSANKSQFINNRSLMKSQQKKPLVLDLKDLNVILERSNELSLEDTNEVVTPFEVVQLTFSSDFLDTLTLYGKTIIDSYKNKGKIWKLNAKGYYVNHISSTTIAIIKTGYLYQGGYIQQDQKIIPNGEGALLTCKGAYKGGFKDGKANGKGVYCDKKSNTTYAGTWKEGDMISGSINCADFNFNGSFQKSLAEGEGVIVFAQHNTKYKGYFKDGLYQDQNGYFESDIYAYSGGFKNGRKQGEGCLIQKQRNLKSVNKNKHYQPQQQYQGVFSNDRYLGKTNSVIKNNP